MLFQHSLLSSLLLLLLVAQSCSTLCDPMDWKPPGSPLHGIFQVRTLEWVAIPFFRGSSRPKDQTQVSCTAGRFFTTWVMREPSNTNARFFVIAKISVSLCSVFFPQSIFPPLFRMSKFYWSFLKFTDFICHLYSATLPSSNFLFLTLYFSSLFSMSFFFITSISLLSFYVISFVSTKFVIAY